MFDFINSKDLKKEDQEAVDIFNEKIKGKIIEDLINYESDKLIKLATDTKSEFLEVMDNIFYNGIKGYKNMPIKLLINIYIEKLGEEKFIELINMMNLKK